MTEAPPTKHWTRVEYERLIDEGVFGPEDRIQLLAGALVVREPQGGPHAMGIRMAEEALRRVFATGWDVRGRLPVARYASVVTLRAGDVVTPLAAPHSPIPVVYLVP
jgi:hypothetical protein